MTGAAQTGLSGHPRVGGLFLVWVCLFAGTLPTRPLPAEDAPWQVGLAKAVITPEKPVWLAGYGSKRSPDGKLHDLWMKAMALQDRSGHRVVLVTSDFQGVPKSMSDRVFEQVREKYGLQRHQIMITFSHNHCGPRLGDDLVDYYPVEPDQVELVNEYTAQMVVRMVAMIGEALQNLVPAFLSTGRGTASFAVNRRNNPEAQIPELMAQGAALKGPVDHQVPVLRVSHPDGNLAAVLFGYACHPTTLSFMTWCGDYPGFAQLEIEQSHPGAMAMFVNTCGGDQNPLPRRTVELCQRYGHMLALGVEQGLNGPMTPIAPELRSTFEFVDLPYLKVIDREDLVAAMQDGNAIRGRWAARLLQKLDANEKFPPSYPYPLHAWRLGKEMLMIGMGAETVVDYALKFKQEFGPDTWVCGYADDMIAYIPSRRVWEEGGYEGGSNLYEYGRPALRWAGDIETRITTKVRVLERQVRPPQPKSRRILYNFDGDSCLTTRAGGKGPVKVTVDDVKKLITEVAYEGSQVDSILVCVNAQTMYYPTKVGTQRGTLSSADERAKWPDSQRQHFENLQMFYERGIDPYAIMLSEARLRGREALLTIRMNDDHGNDFLRTQFWIDHPQWRLGSGALNFDHAEVRDYVFALVEEAVQRYDCDGVELDFNRFPRFFKDSGPQERVEKMNSLLDRIRQAIGEIGKARGKKLVLAVRVPSNFGRSPPTPESSRELGCDVVDWAARGWIDFVTVSEFLFTRFDLPLQPWIQAIGTVPIYGGIECTAGGSKEQYLTPAQYRLAAKNLRDDKAAGIYLFNFFTTREYGAESWEPRFDLLSDLGTVATNEPITVYNPVQLPTAPQNAERIPLGEPDDYKPCIARMPDGELLLTAFHQYPKEGNKVMEQTLLFRSLDGGRSWSTPEKLDLLGREPYLTVLPDGTIFLTGHLLANDERNRWGYTCGLLHRSTDRGRTWETTRIESEEIKAGASNHTSRNVIRLKDGTLLLGVDYDGGGGPYLIWRSTDGGKSWNKKTRCEPRDFASKYGFFGGETWLWVAESRRIWALVRVDSNELPIKDRPIQAGNDQSDHFILFASDDQGQTFQRMRDFGDYGEMYMSLLRLHDRRLLLTFTVRDLRPPLGVRALLGTETTDGFEFDFGRDRLMLDTKTESRFQGGGFGPTVQLDDGKLVTSYSYRGIDGRTHLEVVRWLPPQQK